MIGIARPPCDEAVLRAAPDAVPCGRRAEPWILAAAILGSSMSFIDGTVVNVALPALQRDFHATAADVLWVVEAYSLFLSALILVGGSLGDHFGRRRIFTAGIILFTIASVACGVAQSTLQLIIARGVQGIGGALLVPGSLAIIGASFSDERRGTAIGTWSGFTTITSALGPVLGGLLVVYGSWRYVFLINVPLAVITLFITSRHVPESRDEHASKQLDWLGAGTVTLGLGALVYGLIEAGTVNPAVPVVVGSLITGVGALALFVLVEARSRAPMMPLTLFRLRSFSGANLLTLLLYGALGGALFFVPFTLQQVHGYTAAAAGASFLPFTLIVFALSRWSGGLINRTGARLPLVVGPVVTAIGFVLFALPGTGGSYWTTYFPAVVVLGIGMALVIAPLTTVVMGAAGPDRAGIASGINNAVSRAAGLVAIAVLGLAVAAVFNTSLDNNVARLHLPQSTRAAIISQRARLAGIQIPAGISHAQRAPIKQAIDESYIEAFRLAMLVSSGLALASAGAAWILIEPKKTASTGSRPDLVKA